MLDDEVKKLDEQVTSLVNICKRLREENTTLRVREKTLADENAKLAQKTRLARERIEAIIGKLRALDGRGAK